MSHGATSTQNMAFSNTARLRQSDYEKMIADQYGQARSFSNIGSTNMTDKSSSTNATTRPAFGENAWGSSSIWSSVVPNNLSSGAATREEPLSPDGIPKPAAARRESNEGKSGSGSLVDSSVSEEHATRIPWASKRSAPLVRSDTRYTENGLGSQRNTDNAGVHTMSGTLHYANTLTSRPPTFNLSSAASAQARHSIGSVLGSGLSGHSSKQPPFNVYTKFDRPTDPMQKKPDSAVGSWAESTTTPSPSDERRPQLPLQFSRDASMPSSRDCSIPPSRAADEAPVFTRPDYGRPSQRPTPSSSRAPSISSIRNGAYNPYFTNVDQMTSAFGHANLNGDSRASTSHKESSGHNYHGYLGPFPSSASARQSFSTNGHMLERADEIDEIDRAGINYLGFEDYASAQPTQNLSSSLAERYLSAGGHEFRPGQPYISNEASALTHNPALRERTPNEWLYASGNNLAMSRRSPTVPEQQQYMDMGAHQNLAAQIRAQYAPMYSSFVMNTPYMGLVPLSQVQVDVPPAPRDSPVGDCVQSALMYEFKSNTKTKRYELRDIYDHIAEFSGDQHGSRFIQTKLETANSDEKERVFREIEPNAIPLMTDVFGNYVIQKFFEHGDQTHKKILANRMKGQVLQLSLQMYGCRVVQKALDHVLVDQQVVLISELENHVLKCVKDQNGNHVIQKAIERCPSTTIGFIIAAFHGQVQHLSIHPYGCRVIQRCLEKEDLSSKATILAELNEGIQSMISDQFGNYVVQHIVCHDDGVCKRRVLDIVGRGLEGYSRHKFASNVVEKCLERADDEWRRQVVYGLANVNSRNAMRNESDCVLVGMIKDNFGNYVIQKILDTLCPDDYHLFLEILQPAMMLAKRSGCGKQVLSIDKKMHRFEGYYNTGLGSGSSGAGFQRPTHGYILPMHLPPYGSSYNSATTTPPPLTSDTQSLQSSGLPSVNGDAVEGAAASRKGSEPGSHQSLDGVAKGM